MLFHFISFIFKKFSCSDVCFLPSFPFRLSLVLCHWQRFGYSHLPFRNMLAVWLFSSLFFICIVSLCMWPIIVQWPLSLHISIFRNVFFWWDGHLFAERKRAIISNLMNRISSANVFIFIFVGNPSESNMDSSSLPTSLIHSLTLNEFHWLIVLSLDCTFEHMDRCFVCLNESNRHAHNVHISLIIV